MRAPTEAPGRLQVTLCPPRALFWGTGTSSHPGWKAGCSWWESQGVLGNLPPTPSPLACFPRLGVSKGKPPPALTSCQPDRTGQPGRLQGPRVTGLGKGDREAAGPRSFSGAHRSVSSGPGGVCMGCCAGAGDNSPEPDPISLHRGSSQDPTPAGALPCSQPGTPARSPDCPARDSVSSPGAAVPEPPGHGDLGCGRAGSWVLPGMRLGPCSYILSPRPPHTPRGWDRTCVWSRKHPLAFWF